MDGPAPPEAGGCADGAGVAGCCALDGTGGCAGVPGDATPPAPPEAGSCADGAGVAGCCALDCTGGFAGVSPPAAGVASCVAVTRDATWLHGCHGAGNAVECDGDVADVAGGPASAMPPVAGAAGAAEAAVAAEGAEGFCLEGGAGGPADATPPVVGVPHTGDETTRCALSGEPTRGSSSATPPMAGAVGAAEAAVAAAPGAEGGEGCCHEGGAASAGGIADCAGVACCALDCNAAGGPFFHRPLGAGGAGEWGGVCGSAASTLGPELVGAPPEAGSSSAM